MSTPRSDELLFAAGGDVWEKYGTFVKRTLPEEERGTFSRSSDATFRDRSEVLRTAESGVLRPHYVSGESSYSARLEAARTNLVTQSEDLSTWGTSGTPTVNGSKADPQGGTAAFLVGDDDGSALEFITDTPSFTGDAQKAVSLFIREGESVPSKSHVKLRDTTAVADRLLAQVTGWTNGEPNLTMTTGSLLDKRVYTGGWWRLLLQSTSVTAGNTNRVELYPAADGNSDTGDIYLFGVQAEDASFPSSYIATAGSAVSRAADDLSFPISFGPQKLTVYTKWVERGTGFAGGTEGIWSIGQTTGSGSLGFELRDIDSDSAYRVTVNDADDNFPQTVAALGGHSIGDVVEGIVQYDHSAGEITLIIDPPSVGSSDTETVSFPTADSWGDDNIYIGNAALIGEVGFSDFVSGPIIAPGVRTMDEMRSIEV